MLPLPPASEITKQCEVRRGVRIGRPRKTCPPRPKSKDVIQHLRRIAWAACVETLNSGASVPYWSLSTDRRRAADLWGRDAPDRAHIYGNQLARRRLKEATDGAALAHVNPPHVLRVETTGELGYVHFYADGRGSIMKLCYEGNTSRVNRLSGPQLAAVLVASSACPFPLSDDVAAETLRAALDVPAPFTIDVADVTANPQEQPGTIGIGRLRLAIVLRAGGSVNGPLDGYLRRARELWRDDSPPCSDPDHCPGPSNPKDPVCNN